MEPQVWGMVAGVVVFGAAIITTFVLMVLGGSFKRMREQADTYRKAGPEALRQSLKPRPLLYDELLEAACTLPDTPPLPEEDSGVLRGELVQLRSLRVEDAADLFDACNGSPKLGKAYDPEAEIWRLQPHGPFSSREELAGSGLMRTLCDGRRFKVVDKPSNQAMGMACIIANDPRNLRAEIGDLWLNPCRWGPSEEGPGPELEVLYLLLKYLFGLGYRRVEWRMDAGDDRGRRAAEAAGFWMEGVLRKHMIVKDSNRDTALFALVNSDWRDAACQALEKRLQWGRPQGGGAASAKKKA